MGILLVLLFLLAAAVMGGAVIMFVLLKGRGDRDGRYPDFSPDRICPHCGTALVREARYCSACGKAATLLCPACGSALGDGDVCGSCGEKP